MKQLQWAAMAAILMMIGMNISCSHEMYSEEEAQSLYDSVSPVDTVDANHTWLLTREKTLMIQAPDSGGTQKIKILTSNPRLTGDAEVVGEAWASAGERFPMAVSYPATATELFAALVDDEGKYSIVGFNPNTESSIEFRDLLVDHEKLSYDPKPQQYTYCYEESYPLPGDFDYNDVVMRISQARTGEKEIRITVTLAAVGSEEQVSAAICLNGFKASDIESVKTVDSLSFNRTNGKDISDQMLMVLKDKQFLLTGQHGEAVINLFCDAHWATGDLLDDDFGMMKRKKYNVSTGTGTDYAQFVGRTVTYIVTFKSASELNAFSMDRLDPFILRMFNGGIFEVHQYNYRNSEVIYDYSPSTIKTLPWAFCIPKKDYRWPLEGVNIGFIMKEVHTFGAYQTLGHSFGEWAMDRTRALDWYEYPTQSQVF
jgi:LruC domain-containing protein